jgi:hypothetical protein
MSLKNGYFLVISERCYFRLKGGKRAFWSKRGSKKGFKKGSKRVFLGVFGVISERPILRESQIRPGFQAMLPKRGQKVTLKMVKKCHFGHFLRGHIPEKAWFTLCLVKKRAQKVVKTVILGSFLRGLFYGNLK